MTFFNNLDRPLVKRNETLERKEKMETTNFTTQVFLAVRKI